MSSIPASATLRISTPESAGFPPDSSRNSAIDTTVDTIAAGMIAKEIPGPVTTREFTLIARPDPAERACEILRAEAAAILALAEHLAYHEFPASVRSVAFRRAVQILLRCRGCVVVTGVGKAGLIGRKLSATLASTGARSFFLHPTEAVHGDLGRLGTEDVVLALSQSGETEEMLRILPYFAYRKIPVIAITSSRESPLGRESTVVLETGGIPEAGRLGLAPSSSTTVMLSLGDALALVVSEERGFTHTDFARLHPAGSLGRHLSCVDDFARPLAQCRVARDDLSIRDVFTTHVINGRRSGAIMLTDASERLTGIFTDSDLARMFERHEESRLDEPVSTVMTRSPQTVRSGEPIRRAVERMASRRISELPVVDEEDRPVGMMDITDLVAAFPKEFSRTR
ncbi:MAG: KpsF/GutQ family sugar-phosphate isomerase [Planctomycetia bacterium]|nr:KpsF/GutQ family sugar-phosphate isomerase [Planctomycetia bacterium]